MADIAALQIAQCVTFPASFPPQAAILPNVSSCSGQKASVSHSPAGATDDRGERFASIAGRSQCRWETRASNDAATSCSRIGLINTLIEAITGV